MDAQQTYLLNGLLARNFDLGRISRFRHVARGRQAQTWEILTSEHHEYLISLYPPAFPADQLNFIAAVINVLDRERFSVVPFLPVRIKPAMASPESAVGARPNPAAPSFATEGPQSTTMLVSLASSGSALPSTQYTNHDISQVGLRLAWLHRLLNEQLPAPQTAKPIADQLATALAQRQLPVSAVEVDQILPLLNLPAPPGWAHGDIQPAALLLDSDHQIRTLVDFANLHHGSPLEDLIDAFLTLCPDSTGKFAADRTRCLFESYDSLRPLKQIPWTPVVARYLAQRLLDAAASRRPLPKNFLKLLAHPEHLAIALASSL